MSIKITTANNSMKLKLFANYTASQLNHPRNDINKILTYKRSIGKFYIYMYVSQCKISYNSLPLNNLLLT